MLELPTVTLCCVDTRAPNLALAALARCTARVRFADVLLCTEAARVRRAPRGVRVADVRVPSAAAYSEFLLKALAPHVATAYVLVVQWDGFVLRPDAWDPAFLAYDYVGARWPGFPDDRAVGNGGFSLRSAVLLRALQDPRLVASHPEDVCICRDHRAWLEQEHGIRFAPPAVADRFGFERVAPTGPTFGFHGVYNLPRVLDDPAELHALVPVLPADVLRGVDGRDLCKALIRAGQLGTARDVLRRRRAAGGDPRENRRLALALALAWARRPLDRRASSGTSSGASSGTSSGTSSGASLGA